MSESTDDTINRRRLLQGMSAGAASTMVASTASATEPEPSGHLTIEERAELRAPYDTLAVAGSILSTNTAPLLEELSARDVLSSADSSVLQMNEVTQSSLDTKLFEGVRVNTVWDSNREAGRVLIQTKVPLEDGIAHFTVDPETESAGAMVYDDDGVELLLDASGDDVQELDTASIEKECGDKCGGCGTFSCTKKYEVSICYDSGYCYSECGCTGNNAAWCCEGSCNKWYC